MLHRQSIISVFRPTDNEGEFNKKPSLDIIFRQPYHNLGLAYSFNFSKSFFAPVSNCDITIQNINNEIVDAFYFEANTYTKRPLVKIYAGYSSTKIKSTSQIDELKADLDLVYTGTPYYSADNKIIGGRVFTLQLSDMPAFARSKRVSVTYNTARPLTEIIKNLLDLAKVNADISALQADSEFQLIAIANPLMYNNRQVLTDILLSLSLSYGFYYYLSADGFYIFKPVKNALRGRIDKLTVKNGLIEHPTSINFVHWQFKTLFGMPKIYYPGDRVLIESDQFSRINDVTGALDIVDNTLTGLIIGGNYSFDDSNAEIQYALAGDGQPVTANPIRPI